MPGRVRTGLAAQQSKVGAVIRTHKHLYRVFAICHAVALIPAADWVSRAAEVEAHAYKLVVFVIVIAAAGAADARALGTGVLAVRLALPVFVAAVVIARPAAYPAFKGLGERNSSGSVAH